MARTQITGIVEAVKVVELTDRAATQYGSHRTPVKIEVTIAQADGTKAYISTGIGEKYISLVSPAEGFSPSESEYQAPKDGRWAWGIRQDAGVYRSQSPEMFPNAVFLHEPLPLPSLWRDDVVSVLASVTERTSRNGTRYLSGNRAEIVWVERDGVKSTGRVSAEVA